MIPPEYAGADAEAVDSTTPRLALGRLLTGDLSQITISAKRWISFALAAKTPRSGRITVWADNRDAQPSSVSTGKFSMKRADSILGIAFLLGWGAFSSGIFADPRSAAADSIKIVGASNANITGDMVNFYSPYSYGLVVNVYSDTRAIVDVPLAAVPLNATVNGLQVDFHESSYSGSNGLVSISGYGRNGGFSAFEGSGASTIAGYNSVALGLGPHSVAANEAGVNLVSSLLGTKKHLGLRFAAASSGTNTSLRSVEHSAIATTPSVTVSFDMPSNPQFVPLSYANITGTKVNEFDPAVYGMGINAFDSTKAVLDYSLASIPVSETIASATITFREFSYANSNGLVSIYGYNRAGLITGAVGSAGTLIGSYNSVSLGLGIHTITLNAVGLSIIQSLLGTNQNFGLRFAAASNDTSTQFASLDLAPSFAPPVLSLTFAPKLPGDVNQDGLVNGQDISLVATHWLHVGPNVAGDANRDGLVNGQDIGLIASNWLSTSGAHSAAVPEPSTLLLAALGGLALLTIQRR